MVDELGSTNITDLVNEEDTDINDDMVDKILNDSCEDLFCLNTILNQCKLPLLVFIIVLLFNNPIVTDILSDTISNLIKNKTINNYISLFIRATISAILAYIIKYFDLI